MNKQKFQAQAIITKSSSAAGRSRRRVGNKNTYPHVFFDMYQRRHQLQDALDTCGQVLVLPSRFLVPPGADDDFVIMYVSQSSKYGKLFHISHVSFIYRIFIVKKYFRNPLLYVSYICSVLCKFPSSHYTRHSVRLQHPVNSIFKSEEDLNSLDEFMPVSEIY